MIKKIFNKHISLRWKWTLVLSVAFITLYALVSFVTVVFMKNALYEREKLSAIQYANAIIQTIDYLDEDLNAQNIQNLFDEKNRQLMVQHLKHDGITLRVLDNENVIIYENEPMPYASIPDFNGVSERHYKNKRVLEIVKDIHGQDDTVVTGKVQMIVHFKNYEEAMAHLDKVYLLITVVSCIICALLASVLAYVFFRPIQHMNEVMSDIKQDALSKKRMNLSSRKQDELTDLSVGFNDLLDTMDLYINQQKQFVEDVSHELRTPVAIVEGHLQLLNRWGKNDPNILEESLQSSLSEIERMKTLVQEMLDLSRAEQVGIHYQDEMVEVVGVLEQVYQNFKLIHPTFTFVLDRDIVTDEQGIWVNMSRHHLEQVLIILLDNAVKYSTDQLHVHMAVSNTITNVQISIQDFGEGISEENITKVFGRFYRVDKARSRHKGGNGLGLSIAKELIEGYSGSIRVESVLGSGSIFRIEFPIVNDHGKIIKEKRKKKQETLMM